MVQDTSPDNMFSKLQEIGAKALKASRALATLPSEQKCVCLNAMADAILKAQAEIIEANASDLQRAKSNGLSDAMLDRLMLNTNRIQGMADGLRQVSLQSDPVGRIISSVNRPNGLKIDKISVPIGVIGIIYESRPNVTSDAAGICIKAGNAVILRGGSEAFDSNLSIAKAMNRAAMSCGLPDGAVQLVPWTDRAAVGIMLKMDKYIDLIIPRGGEQLIRTVVTESTIPVLKHYKGVCHIYVDISANLPDALDIIENAKCQRPSACNAAETILIDRKVASEFIPLFSERMAKKHVELRGDEFFCKNNPDATCATEDDYYAEYLDYILAVKIVDGVDAAVEHINFYGSHHSDAIVSNTQEHIEYFFANVDSATVYANASTRFTDGGEFGMGAEIGISTDKIHSRGPMGADELTSYKYLIRGTGQIRN